MQKRRRKRKTKKSPEKPSQEEEDLNGLSDLEELGLMAEDLSQSEIIPDEASDKKPEEIPVEDQDLLLSEVIEEDQKGDIEEVHDESSDEVMDDIPEEIHDEEIEEEHDDILEGIMDEVHEEPMEEFQEEPLEELQKEPVKKAQEEPPKESQEEPAEEIQEEPKEEFQKETSDDIPKQICEVVQDEVPEDAFDDVLDEFLEEPSKEALESSSVIPDIINSFEICAQCGGQLINGECLACARRDELERYLPKGMEDVSQEDQYHRWKSEMRSKGELNLFGIFCVIVASIYIIYISYPPVLDLLTGEFILDDFLLNFILLIFGLGALLGGLAMARHVIIYGRLFDTTFEKEIYSRLEPAFAEVGNVKGDIQEINDRIERMNIHLKRLEIETRTATQISSVSVHSSSALRYMALMILSLGVFFFLLNYPDFYLPYAYGALFLAWWAGITSDFTLWKVNVSWTWAFFAIVFVIPGAILIDVIYGLRVVTGIMGIALALYAFSYYAWAKFYVEGATPSLLPIFGEDE